MDIPDSADRHASSAPQLRTLLLTDLCDSTSLVERMGDTAATELFREHDRLVLKLQQQWHGRLIDRSDGMLLLFERPIDGLGFALDYEQGLREMGTERGLVLQARAGIHVGEVLTWRNSDEAVKVGSKPLEVEGLAKPMCGRLMTMARPGQILLSAVAEPLAHRAARELGDRGTGLLWKSHGRWRFKGVPEPQEIYEVGEPGVAPLRAPPDSPKAWRDIPLWRRPAALAAELALIVGLGVGLWFVTRAQPAIAFAERDWVVVGDLRNLTGDKLLDDSLEQAFRISLEQSRYVNVLSDLKARDTLARMQRKPDTMLDRSVASEIALRDGARAVILPTVAEIGGRVRVSAEVIDPHTQTTVYAESADGTGAASALNSIDRVTATLRDKLGEALSSIDRDSAPLPQVTSRNLDALRAYALAQKAYQRSDFTGALQLYQRATKLDPEFALAWLGQMRVQFSLVNAPAGIEPLRRAQSLRNRLPPREAMYMDAWATEFDAPAKTVDSWLELARLYPDFLPAQHNAALWLYEQNRFEQALPYAQMATKNQSDILSAHDTLGRVQLGQEHYALALQAFNQGYVTGGGSMRRLLATQAAQRNFANARKLERQLPKDEPHPYMERTSLAVDQGRWVEARELSRQGLIQATPAGRADGRIFMVPVAVVYGLTGDGLQASRRARDAADRALAALSTAYDADAKDDVGIALSAALIAQRFGDDSLADKVLNGLKPYRALMEVPQLAELEVIVRAGEARRLGRAKDALRLLQPLLTGHERYQTRVALMEAYIANGNRNAALEQARWLQRRRGLAYVELECGHCLQALNVADSTIAILVEAELLAQSGKPDEAAKALKRFDRLWPAESLPSYLRIRRSALRAVSRLGVV